MLVALIWPERYESLKYCRSENVSQSCFYIELAVNFVSMFTTVSSYYYLFPMNLRQDLHILLSFEYHLHCIYIFSFY